MSAPGSNLYMSRYSTRTGLLAACVLAMTGHAVSAENGEQVASLSPVLVTATRTAQTANDALASVTVLGRSEIEASGAESLTDLLGDQPGISAAKNGPFGKTASLYLRGTNSDHVLVLVDGIKLGSATTGTTAFQHLPLDQIERIEIVRGPRSSLYGSEAIGGVIQIFTREGIAEGVQAQSSVMTGGKDTSEVSAAFSGGDDDSRFSFSAKAFDTEGIDARSDGFPDKDGYTNDSASLRFAQDLGDTTTWSVRALRAEGTSEFDNCGSFSNPSGDCSDRYLQQSASTSLDTQITDRWSASFTLGSSKDESRLFTDGQFDSAFATRRDEFSWQNDLAVSDRQVVTLGVDYREDRVSGTSDYDETRRENTAVFAQWQWMGERTDASISARHDDNEAFGEETTGTLALGYRFAESARVFGSLGTGFKAPTFNDLFFPDTAFFSSNPDLDPETSRTLELGVKGGSGDSRWTLSSYRTEIDDIIVFDSANATVNNLDTVEITGIELGGRTVHAGWELRASATLLETELDTDDANDGNELPRRPERKLTLGFGRDFGRVDVGASVRHESDRFDDAGNSTELGGFTVVDARLGYELYPELELEASVENLGDADYQTVDNFNSLGRTGYVRLRYQPR